MPHFVMLANFTDQGVRNVKDTRKRADAFKSAAKELGCTVKEVLWTQGQYDFVIVLEAPDETTASALALSVAKLGNIRGQTLRAFTA
ncbi:MAG: GYD domain-containing protein, partial [Hyphomicrobiales bacterium]|nr:GYD domain-containing protein [Hyphomicrobiales bacterium]MBV8664295.1 GYD domain-containing protein [Hyphomicrobiales bacterium]